MLDHSTLVQAINIIFEKPYLEKFVFLPTVVFELIAIKKDINDLSFI